MGMVLLHGSVVPSTGLSANERENLILKLKKLKHSSGASSLVESDMKMQPGSTGSAQK